MTGIYIPVWMREVVIQRSDGGCEYCQTPAAYSPEIFEFDHPRPRQAEEPPELDNLAWSCPACNRHKTNRAEARDPVTGEPVLLFNPRADDWAAHFRWSNDLQTIVGLTPAGRATIDALKMNRPAVAKFRLALKSIGQHPAQLAEENNVQD